MGPGIVLIILGAILTFAVRGDTNFVNLHVVGIIFLVAGGVLVYYARNATRARKVTTVEDLSDPDRPVRTVALCGGAGDFLLDTLAGSGADVYVTSDLRHHPAAEFLEKEGPALVDVAHWAAEWTWLPVVERKLVEAVRERGDTVETRVSTTVTDPWSFRTG